MPGTAIARAMTDIVPGARSLFLATSRQTERQCRHALEEFEVREIPAARWDGWFQKARFSIASLAAAGRSLEILRSFRPNVVVGLGGYSCIVPVLVARAMALPTMVLESNAVPGRVVRLLAPIVDCVQLQWREAADHLHARRTLVTGNPVRPQIFHGIRETAVDRLGLESDRLTLVVMGGSQGALPINRAVTGALESLKAGTESDLSRLQILHLTGPDHLAEAKHNACPDGLLYRPMGFADGMEDVYAAADLALGRAGGSTLAEITAVGLPSLLVPYPHASDDHQHANAGVLARAGAAQLIEQESLSPGRLASLLKDLTRRPSWLSRMADRAARLGHPRAAWNVAAELADLAGLRVGPRDDETADEGTDTDHTSALLKAA